MTLSRRFRDFLARPVSKHTRDKYYYRLRPFVQQNADLRPEDVTTAMIAHYIDQQTHLAEASRAILRSCFHAFLAFCNVDPNPAAALPRWRETPRRVHVPDEDAVKRVIDEAVTMSVSGSPTDKRDGLIFVLAAMSGNRRGELRNLPLPDLRAALAAGPDEDVWRVYSSGKTGECTVRFTRFHLPFFWRYLAVRPSQAAPVVFVNLDPRQDRYGSKLSLTAFNRARWKVCQRAKVESITYQELRRRVATRIARARGVDIAAHALGHSPASGDRVIRAFYYDPDAAAVDAATLAAFQERQS